MVLFLLAFLNLLFLTSQTRHATGWNWQRKAGLGLPLYLVGLLTISLTNVAVASGYSLLLDGSVFAHALTLALVGGLWTALILSRIYQYAYRRLGGERNAG